MRSLKKRIDAATGKTAAVEKPKKPAAKKSSPGLLGKAKSAIKGRGAKIDEALKKSGAY